MANPRRRNMARNLELFILPPCLYATRRVNLSLPVLKVKDVSCSLEASVLDFSPPFGVDYGGYKRRSKWVEQ
jgi:hypothetical protein